MGAPPPELWLLAIVIAAFVFIGLPAIRASVAIPDRIDWREVAADLSGRGRRRQGRVV